MTISLKRSNSDDPDFVKLVAMLDAYLAKIDGTEHAFYAKLNTISKIKHVVLAYDDKLPVGCGAIKQFGDDAMEIKRMFVLPEKRNIGIATRILFELETWTHELSYARCVLETGKRQPDAIELYKKNGFMMMANYGQYIGVENSLCFEKQIR